MAGDPVAELDARYSSPDATATPWVEARRRLEEAELFWLTTVRPDGRPHVTPLIAVWLDGAMYLTTGPAEAKAGHLAASPHCILTTGCNTLNEGLDLVVEGDATEVRDGDTLRRVAEAYEAKYAGLWRPPPFWSDFGGRPDGGSETDVPLVFKVAPVTVFGFGKDVPSQTRWRFGPG